MHGAAETTAETTSASICVQRDLTLYMSGGDEIVPLYPCCVFDEPPVCPEQERSDEN